MIKYILRLLRKRAELDALQAVRGTRGYYHATFGEQRHFNKLWTLCSESVLPLHRASDKNARIVINCPRCLDKLRRML